METATARALGGLLHDLTDDELLVLTDSDSRRALKRFLIERMCLVWNPVSYDRSVGLVQLIRSAVGDDSLQRINRDITQKRFPLGGTGVRSVRCRVEAGFNGETLRVAAQRIKYAGHVLGRTGDLAGFLRDHPEEVSKWTGGVHALGRDTRWMCPEDDKVRVPYALVTATGRRFGLIGIDSQLASVSGILVTDE